MDKKTFVRVQMLNCSAMVAGVAILSILEQEEAERQKRRDRRYWVSPYLKERNAKGRFATDFEDICRAPELFKKNFHMPFKVFEELFALVEPHLIPQRNTRPNDFIPPKAKLAVVLEYMASGDLQRHLASCYRISKMQFGRIVDAVCDAICAVLKPQIPEWTEEKLMEIAAGFEKEWNFPNCVGAIDGKHVSIKAPPNSGSIFFNCKGFFSIVILATCDAHYKFTYLDIGAYGSEGDCNIFKNSKLGSKVLSDTFPFPEASVINGKRIPFYIVGDDAFPLCKRLMKPYGQKNLSREERIYNYSISRARRCIENSFGILSAKWLCLRKVLFCGPDRAQKLVSACCLLHNFLLNEVRDTYCPPSFSGAEDREGNWVDGEWPVNAHIMDSIAQTDLAAYHGRSSDYGKYIRNTVKDFVNSPEGTVPWQERAAFV